MFYKQGKSLKELNNDFIFLRDINCISDNIKNFKNNNSVQILHFV